MFLPEDGDSDEIEVRIVAVVKGTLAEDAGLRRGMIVDKINGVPIRMKGDSRLLPGVKTLSVFPKERSPNEKEHFLICVFIRH